MVNLENTCDALYSGIGNLPKLPEQYSIWFGGHNENSTYRVIINRDKEPRKKSWDKLLAAIYFGFPELDLSKNSKFKTNVWNTFLGSGYKLMDEENNKKITAYTPWYSFLLKPFLGGDLIVVKYEKKHNFLSNLFNRKESALSA